MRTFVFFFNADTFKILQFKRINFLMNCKTVGFKRVNNSPKLHNFKVHPYESKMKTSELHTTKSLCI